MLPNFLSQVGVLPCVSKQLGLSPEATVGLGLGMCITSPFPEVAAFKAFSPLPAPQEQQLCHDPFGRYAVRNFALTHFRKRRKDWDQVQEAETRRRELFAEILED